MRRSARNLAYLLLGLILAVAGSACETAERSPLEQRRINIEGTPNDGAERFGSKEFQDNKFRKKGAKSANPFNNYLKELKYKRQLEKQRKDELKAKRKRSRARSKNRRGV